MSKAMFIKMDRDAALDRFLKETRKAIGEPAEIVQWNSSVTRESVNHFAKGIGDENPRWTAENYEDRVGRRVAPPTYLCSVARPLAIGPASLIPPIFGEVEFEWSDHVYVGDRFSVKSEVMDVYEKHGKTAGRMVHIASSFSYINQDRKTIAKAKGTIMRIPITEKRQLFHLKPYKYSQNELKAIEGAELNEYRRGHEGPNFQDLKEGDQIGPIVRGPLHLGDMVAWYAGTGWENGAAGVALRKRNEEGQPVTINPLTGDKVNAQNDHVDPYLCKAHGYPLPFAEGDNELGYIGTLFTNWLGDTSRLVNIKLRFIRPYFYSHTMYVTARIQKKRTSGSDNFVDFTLSADNQLKENLISGTATVLIK